MMPHAIGPHPARRAVLASACAVTVGAAWACLGRAGAAEPTAVTITLSSTSFGAAALFLADKLGLFRQHGLAAKLVVMDSGSLAVAAALSGSAQFTVSGVSDALAAASHGRGMKLVANVYHGLSGSVVIGKAVADKLGIRSDSPLDARRKALDGLSVAIPSPTSSYVPPVVGAAAAANGKANLIYMAQPTMVAALQAGAVQALMAGSPFWEPAVTSGVGLLLLDGPSGDFPPDAAPISTLALETTADYASAHPGGGRRRPSGVRRSGAADRDGSGRGAEGAGAGVSEAGCRHHRPVVQSAPAELGASRLLRRRRGARNEHPAPQRPGRAARPGRPARPASRRKLGALEALLQDEDGAGVVTLTLNRPERRNALDPALIAGLTNALERLAGRPEVRAVVLTGAGASFSAGADIAWMRRMGEAGEAENLADAAALTRMLHVLDRLSKPTLALVRGAAYGGGVGLAACCDVVIASETASFCLSEVRLGLIPAAISPYVVNAIGSRQARRYFSTAEVITAARARELGLAHEVVPEVDLPQAGRAMIGALLQGAPGAQAEAKALVFLCEARPVDEVLGLETGQRIARRRATPEGREGLDAFLAKRPPAWQPG